MLAMETRTQMIGIVALICPLLVSSPSFAKKLYKYTDEKGIIHYTDKKPNTEHPVESRILKVKPEYKLKMRNIGNQEKPQFLFRNLYFGPIEVEVYFPSSTNISTRPNLPHRFVMEANSEQQLFTLAPRNPNKSWSYQLAYRYIPGEPNSIPSLTQVYLPPFAKGKSFQIHQAFGGKFSHKEKSDFHAVDIALPEGTAIHAARDGIVMDVDRDFYGAGLNMKKYGNRANQIRILHNDGTMAVYAHLQLESTLVRPGQIVLAGDKIGLSGNTGYSTGPHLHFVIQKNSGLQLASIGFKFKNASNKLATPEKGAHLRR